MKYTYQVESFYMGKWCRITQQSRDYCLGFLSRTADSCPRNPYRVIRSDGKVIAEVSANPDVSIGMVAGWPTAEQYEAAANRALAQAAQIRERQAKHDERRSDQ